MLPKISMRNGHAANGPTDDDLAEIKSAVLAKLVLVRVDGFRITGGYGMLAEDAAITPA
jgi:hypothetical protein